MRVYLAGPMRGHPHDNHEAFDKAEAAWIRAGHDPVSPAYLARALGKGAEGGFDTSPAFIRQVMVIDAIVICSCDAVAVLPGWERSRGATMEVALAHSLGILTYDAITMRRVELPTCPWATPSTSTWDLF